MEKKENLIGRKVKITEKFKDVYPEYVGKEGVVIKDKEDEKFLVVKMADGEEIWPYKPGTYNPQCELLPEENEYHIDRLRDKKVAIHCTTAEEYKQVVKLMDVAHSSKMFNDTQGWKSYEDEVVVYCNDYPMYGSKRYAKEDGSKIITAEQFISQNQPTMNKNTQALEQIEALKKQIAAIEESLKEPVWEPKVGDWITILYSGRKSHDIDGQMNANNSEKLKAGDTVKITKVGAKGSGGGIWLYTTGDIKDAVQHLLTRKATPEEIAANQQVTVTIGVKETAVKITKGRIEAAGREVPIEEIEKIVRTMTGTKEVCGWVVTMNTIDIGCCTGITAAEMKAVQDAYHKING